MANKNTEERENNIKEIHTDNPAPRRSRLRAVQSSVWTNIFFSGFVPLFVAFTLEWVARNTLEDNSQGTGFFQALENHLPSFILSLILLITIYVFVSQLSKLHVLATAVVGALGYVPAVVTHYKLTLRSEPFLPWDITQIGDLMGVSSGLSYDITEPMIVTGILFALLLIASAFVRLPKGEQGVPSRLTRFVAAGTALVCACILMFGIFLNPNGSQAVGIRQDMWMQDRYSRNHGVITAFLTNLQMLQIAEPENYSTAAVEAIAEETMLAAQDSEPLFSASFAGAGGSMQDQQPNIIFLMAESFWDVTALEGIEYDQDVMANFNRLSQEAASGQIYSPSYGGGTCDVEFEALTGFSMEFLPAGSKPYQQYTGDPMFSTPQYLKDQGYQTLAIHAFGSRFWNRDRAYPQLGIDEFIASEDFINPERRRGYITDNEMVNRIIEEYEAGTQDGPMFIHAVSMQNHTSYDPDNYPPEELVHVIDSPQSIPESTIGQLEDCATGIRDMDAALGKLTDYFAQQDEPTIIVFWGDHLNPMSDGTLIFEETGYIDASDEISPELYQTPLLIWSNFDDSQVELGTLGSYYLSTVMMDLYGLDKPLMFEYLTQQFSVLRARTRGVTLNTDNSTTLDISEEQQEWMNNHQILQYDFMFGEQVLPQYIPE